ncbi:MAG TPA: DUF5916 domain-containing protein [Flavisolibacter sp.]|nr:DUF5916 domain-containing protein [Flavisolibacter sp.]
MLRLIVLGVFVFIQLLATGQPKTLPAVKTAEAPHIDGQLNDAAWLQASVASDFIQNFPTYGQPASVKTDVKILYDNSAVYIGAYLYDAPSLIRKQLTARDAEQRQDVDYFSVFFDTYNDQQNGFQFLVTPANVQTDAKLNPNANTGFGDFGDRTWDAVWESKTTMVENGWIVEMRIPYISLRFAKKELQTWGIQFLRFTRRNNESSYWNAVDPNENGFVNQFGKYSELRDIKPPLRLSFSPYVSTGARFNPEGSRKAKEWLQNGGMDVKYGLNESFTLDATLIPDFGQVVSDNIVNNLSPFEIRFQENRPFFTEGTELFNKSGLFYSRRVGAIPSGYYGVERFVDNSLDYQIIRNPTMTQLYNGIKFSGRTKKKLGIGVFNAVTAPMKARLRHVDTKLDTLIDTEPLSNYNIIVIDQALKGRSSLTFTNTNVMRNGSYRDANVSAFDWSLYTPGNQFRFSGTMRYSKIFGYTPFNGSVNLVNDTISRNGGVYVKPYDGFNTSLRFAKVSGKVQFSVSNNIISNTYDPNDLGYLQTANIITSTAGISYNQFTPTEKFITYRYSLNLRSDRLYKPSSFTQFEIWTTGFWVFKNFWDVTVNIGTQPVWQKDFFELRTPGKYLKRPAFTYISAMGSTDSRKRLFFSYQLGYTRSDIQDGNYYLTAGGLRYRFSDKFTLSLDVSRQQDDNQVGYAFIRETNGDPIIGYRKSVEIASVLSGIYNFNSRLNLTLRSRHYWNTIGYKNFFNVDANGNYVPRAFISGQDENYNVFNIDAFFTWDFRLGSRLILGWKNWLGNEYGVDGTVHKSYLNNLGNTFNISHGNELTLRFIYFLDYNQLRKKR